MLKEPVWRKLIYYTYPYNGLTVYHTCVRWTLYYDSFTYDEG